MVFGYAMTFGVATYAAGPAGIELSAPDRTMPGVWRHRFYRLHRQMIAHAVQPGHGHQRVQPILRAVQPKPLPWRASPCAGFVVGQADADVLGV